MRQPSPRRRVRRILLALGAAAALHAVLGFLLLPPLVRSQLEHRLAAQLGRPVEVGKVRLNPYTLSLAIEDFRLQEPGGGGTFVAWERLFVDFSALASLRGTWVIGAIDLTGLQVAVTVRPGGDLNFSDLLARFAPAPKTQPPSPGAGGAPRPLRVDILRLAGARVDFTDRSRARPFATTLGPVSFTLAGLHTGGDAHAPYRFEAETEAGEKLAWSGTLQASPFRSTGEFRLEHVPLAKYEPYHGEHHQAEIAEGRLSLRGRYEIALAESGRTLRLTDAAVQLRGLRLLERPSLEPVFEVPLLDIDGIAADALARRVEVASVSLVGGYLRARREKDGRVNLLALLPPPPGASSAPPVPATAAAPGAASANPPPPKVRIAAIKLRECALDFVDLAAPRPVWISLTALQAGATGVSLAGDATLPVEFSCAWAPRGTIRLAGEIGLQPQPRARLQAEVADLDVMPLGPYLEQFLNVRLTQGSVSLRQKVDVAATPAGAEATLTGNFRAGKFSLVDSTRNEELAGLTALDLEGIEVSTTAPGHFAIAEVKLAGPYAHLALKPDGTLNLATLVRPPTGGAPTATPAGDPASPAAPPSAAPAPRIEIARLAIRDGEFTFSDRSASPPVQTRLGQFGGSLTGLSSAHLARASVELAGTVDGAGPIKITGRLDPLGTPRFVDLKVEGRNVDLVPFSPYSGRFAGFELARGKLGLDLQLKLDGSALDAANVVRVDRLTFGAPVASPDATKLPVRLGVALLKDLDGRIVIDLPIQGRLDDPEFRVGRVVGRVLGNLLTKAAVSPFTLLGSMFGGGGEELAYQEFAPGSSTLQASELPKLATLIQALSNRPELSLALEGGFDPAADTHALKRVKLADLIRRSVWQAKHAADPNTPPPEQLVLTPEDEAAMLKQLYDRQFPPGTEFGTPLPAPPEVVRPPAPPAGLFQRMMRAMTGRAKQEALAVEQENARRQSEHRQAMERALASARPIDEMIGRLAEAITVDAGDLEALAAARAQRVRDHFIAKGQLAADRFFLSKASAGATASRGPRVFLSLQ